ncbi:hypothetical protein [Streptomyces sp. NPDC006527]|uniref:hypothetical protein n=1 Tax=Streptomyces sp. NPDC006527 TaxID=3364749 RepID=UPI00367ADBE4
MRAAADAAGVAVLGVPAGLRWDRAAETRAAFAQGHGEGVPERGGDLFSLAQTVATLTGGVVSIEDAAHRVVAYAGSGDEATNCAGAPCWGAAARSRTWRCCAGSASTSGCGPVTTWSPSTRSRTWGRGAGW